MLKDRLYKDASGNVYTTKFSVKDLNGATIDSDGVSYRDDGARLIGTRDKRLTTYDVCPGTITINEIAFFNCKKLESVEIACTVVAIGASAFRNTALTELVIPDSVEAIEKYAFCDIKSLKRVVFEGEVAEIEPKAFFGSDAIEEVVVPADAVEHYKALLPNLADKITTDDSSTIVSSQPTSDAGKNGAMKEIVVTIATQAGAAYDLCPVGEDEEDVVNCLVEDKDYEELKQFMDDSDKTQRSYAYNEYEPVTVTAKEGDKVVFEEEYCEACELGYFDLCSENDITDSGSLDDEIKEIRRKVADSDAEEFSRHYLSLFYKAGLKMGDAPLVIGRRCDTPLLMSYTIRIPADEEFDVNKLCIMWLCQCNFDWHPRYDAEDSGERCADAILYDGTLYEGTCSEEDEDGKETLWATNDLSSYKSLIQNRDGGEDDDDNDFFDDDFNPFKDDEEIYNGNEEKSGKKGSMKEIVVTIASKAGAAYDLYPVPDSVRFYMDNYIRIGDCKKLRSFLEDSDETQRSYAYNEYEPVTVTAKEGDRVIFEEEYCEACELGYFDLFSENDITDSDSLDDEIKEIRRKVADSDAEEFSRHYLSLFYKAGLKMGDAPLVIGRRRDTPLLMSYTIRIPADEEFDVNKLCIMWLCQCNFDWHPRYDAEDSGERCADAILYDGTLYEGTCIEEDKDGKETLWVTKDLSSYKSLMQNRDESEDDDDKDFFDDDFNPFKDDEDDNDEDETDENTDDDEGSEEDGTKCLTIEGIGFDVLAGNEDNSDDFIVITEGLKITLDGEDITDLVSKEPYNDNEQILDEINTVDFAFWEFCSIDVDKNLVKPTHCECTLDVDGDFDPSKIRLLRSGDVDGEWPEIVLQHAKFGPNFNHNRDAIPNLTGFLASHIYYDDELTELDIQDY